MNLTKLFNFKYLKQNLKKSKVTLAFVLLILPILNLIIFLMDTNSNYIQVLGLTDVSGLTTFGMYILPIVLSIILFSFVFKKKSIDFMGSMPIDRKTIFATNTVGGIIIIFLLLAVTTFLMAIASFALSSIYVPVGVFFDYFIVFLVSYVFVFTACNLAMSISGNVATTLVVTALILFFVPYHHFVYKQLIGQNYNTYYSMSYNCKECNVDEYIDWMCGTEDEKCAADIIHNQNYKTDLRKVEKTTSYTMPGNIIVRMLYNTYVEETIVYENSMIGKMALISILYILIGCSLFEKREMEVCETSFKKFRTHQIVKILTLIPIFTFVAIVLEYGSLIGWIFAFFLVLVYNFVYDLITRHSIEKITKNIGLYIITFVSVTAICTVLQSNSASTTIDGVFTDNDIKSTKIELSSFHRFGDGKYVKLEDKTLTKKILQGLYPRSTDENTEKITVRLNINDNIYEGTTYLAQDTYKVIEKIVQNSNTYKNISLKEKMNQAEIITVGQNHMVLNDEATKILKENTEDQEILTDDNLYVNIYTYENHKLKKYPISTGINKKFRDSILKQYNNQAKEVKLDQVYHISISNLMTYEQYYVKNMDYESLFLAKVLKTNTINWSDDVYKITIYSNDKIYFYYTNLQEDTRSYIVQEDKYYGG